MSNIINRIIILLVSGLACSVCIAELSDTELGLIGMWEARRIAGPHVHGDIIFTKNTHGWWVDVAGTRASVNHINGTLSFDLPGGRGSFRGKINPTDASIKGHWIQPRSINSGMRYSSPVILKPMLKNQWRGQILPMPDEFSLFLPVWKRDEHTMGAFLRNPERGFGAFLNVDRIELNEHSIDWVGQFFRNENQTVLLRANYDASDQASKMAVSVRGNRYDMRLLKNDEYSHFYARGKHPEPYQYQPPTRILEDGWPTASLSDVLIDEKRITDFIDKIILKPADSIDDPYIHGFLIARSGKLVLEEYFHGFHRNKPHDTRSASKSLTSVLAGAVIQAGLPLTEQSPVFETILGKVEKAFSNRKKNKIRLHHLLSMSSGLDCDDGNAQSPGQEDTMQSQNKQPDWYRYTMDLPMVAEPGAQAVYCSAGMNLVGAVLSASTGRTIEELFHELIAEPLQIDRYYLNLSPTGQPYLGGGIYWLPRDFMKLGQLMLNGGTWAGKRVLSQAFVDKSISAMYQMQNKGYGYAWWSVDYPYRYKTISTFFAAGNGGQIVMGIPELDLLVAFYAGNYSHPTLHQIQQEFVPKYILPAIHLADS